MEAQDGRSLPHPGEMYAAVTARDTSYDGVFVLGVKSTGIFCRPGCPARTPLRRNVTFFATPTEALSQGFRPCLRCRPLEPRGHPPRAIRTLLTELDADPALRIRDRDLRARGIEPATVRRWFRRHHGMTFQAFQRTRRLGNALGALAGGAPISETAFGLGYESLSGFHDAVRAFTGHSPARSRNTMVVQTTQLVTPLGPMILGATPEAACVLEFVDPPRLQAQLERLAKHLGCVFAPGTNAVMDRMSEELHRYFAGALTHFETPLLVPGTEFQRKAWAALRDIPYGETRSYGEQARAIGKPSAVRAVARANGANRIAIVIPCHRVVGSDGSLTGYGGGLARKRFLLELEQGSGQYSSNPSVSSM